MPLRCTVVLTVGLLLLSFGSGAASAKSVADHHRCGNFASRRSHTNRIISQLPRARGARANRELVQHDPNGARKSGRWLVVGDVSWSGIGVDRGGLQSDR